jgi:hypothetical protein
LPENKPNEGSLPAEVVAWARDRWRGIAALLFVLFVMWCFSGKRPDETGRYVLVKDDIPCQMQREDEDGRKWCDLVLDTRSGKLEERVRKVGSQKKRN